MTALLQIDRLGMRFGGLVAIDKLSFAAEAGQITALIGPNGAGKTTVFNCVTGFYRPTSGAITLAHPAGPVRLDRMPGHRIAARAGVARTFQNVRLFPGLSVLENLLVAQHHTLMRASGFSIAGLLGLPSWRAAEAAAIEKARDWLSRIGLEGRANEAAGILPYGQQRRLEIARAMCTGPRLLCLDEPAAGLNPRETEGLTRLLIEIRDVHATAILLIEHDMGLVMQVSDKIVVLDHGVKIADAPPAAVRRDPAVIRAYLGEDEPEC